MNLQKKLAGQKKRIFQDWTRPIVSDESVFQLRKTSEKTKLYIYRQTGQDERRRNPMKLSGVQIQGSITAWGCLSYWGFGCSELLEENMDSSHYVEKTLTNF